MSLASLPPITAHTRMKAREANVGKKEYAKDYSSVREDSLRREAGQNQALIERKRSKSYARGHLTCSFSYELG